MNLFAVTRGLDASTKGASALRKGNSLLSIHKYDSDRTAQKNKNYKGYSATPMVVPLKAKGRMLQKQGS